MIDIFGKILLIIGIVVFSILTPICLAAILINVYNILEDIISHFWK